MTVAGETFYPDRAGFSRWTVSLLVVLALHAALLVAIAFRHVAVEPIGMPPAAVMIDLAPLPATAPPEPSPPPIIQPEVQTPPEPQPELVPVPEPETPKLAPSPAPHPAVTLPTPQPPKPKPKAKRIEHPPTSRPEAEATPALREPAPPAMAPPAMAPPAATAQPAPTQSTASSAASARASWQAQLVAWLEKYKRYPRVAQEQHQQGVVSLRFAIDRQGKVLSSQISKSSGFELLDEEVLALIARAEPVPAPPPEVGGSRIELQVPVGFSLKR
jgi:periplasmic protein TonB